jgi:hypothetical protein
MKFRYVMLSFLVMGWGYYEMSGGADFVPATRATATPDIAADEATTLQTAEAPEALPDIASRSDTTLLTDVSGPPSETPSDLSDVVATAEAAPAQAPSTVQEEIAAPADDALVFTSLAQPRQTAPDTGMATDTATSADDIAEVTLAQAVTVPDPSIALRQVTGSAVNMREGPGTIFSVVTTLPEGTQTQVIDTENGWALIRVQPTGAIGWIATRFLSDGPT